MRRLALQSESHLFFGSAGDSCLTRPSSNLWAEALLEFSRKFEGGEVNPWTVCDPVSLRGGLMELRKALDESLALNHPQPEPAP